MQPPCYDTKTKTDCSRRSSVCRVSCKAWDEYDAYKREKYAKNDEERKAREAEFDTRRKKDAKIVRKEAKRLYG